MTLLTVTQVAARLNVSKQRVYDLIKQRRLPAVRLGRQLRVEPSALEAWIKNGGSPHR